jgi:hypothetical protein
VRHRPARGELRDLEDPYRRSEDISYAIDTLSAIPGIDPERIGVLGICAAGGYAVHVARTDHRVKAVGTIVPSNLGTSFRGFQPDGPVAALDAMAKARTQENRTGELTRQNWLPDTLPDAAAIGFADIDTTYDEPKNVDAVLERLADFTQATSRSLGSGRCLHQILVLAEPDGYE